MKIAGEHPTTIALKNCPASRALIMLTSTSDDDYVGCGIACLSIHNYEVPLVKVLLGSLAAG